MQNVTGVLAKWGATIPPERVHVVTVPGAGAPPSQLWERFASVLGLQDAQLGAADRPANASLSAAAAGLLRDFNIGIGGYDYPWRVYDAAVKHDIAVRMSDVPGARIELPEDAYDWARSWSAQAAEQLNAAGYHIVGDLTEIMPATRPTGVDPDAADPAERAAAGLVAMTNFARRIADAESHIFDLDQQLDEARTALADAEAIVAEHRALRPMERIKRCGVELAGQVRWARTAHRIYRRLRRREAVPPA